MLATAYAGENGSQKPSALACRFLNARIAPITQDRRFRGFYACSVFQYFEIVGCARGREGFNPWDIPK
jgi:hypothetical protein